MSGLGHFLDPVKALQQRPEDDNLLGLALLLLKIATNKDIEELVGAADFNISPEFD